MLVIAPLTRPFLFAVALSLSDLGWLAAGKVFRGLVASSCVHAAFSHSSSSVSFLKIHGGLQDILKAPIALSQLAIALVAGGVLRGGIMLLISAGAVRIGVNEALVRTEDVAYIFALLVNASVMGVIVGLFCRDYTSTKSIGDTFIQSTLLVSVALIISAKGKVLLAVLGPWSALEPLVLQNDQRDKAVTLLEQLLWFAVLAAVLMWKAARVKSDLEATI